MKFEVHDPVLSFPGKSCKDRATSMEIRKRMVKGGGGANMVGVQSDSEVEKKLAAHKKLLVDLLR